jgi:hypothetical protein
MTKKKEEEEARIEGIANKVEIVKIDGEKVIVSLFEAVIQKVDLDKGRSRIKEEVELEDWNCLTVPSFRGGVIQRQSGRG